MNKNYRNGANKERRIVNQAREKGCISFRSAGSHSVIDVVIIDFKERNIELVQSKPKSMSVEAKMKLEESLKYLNGEYKVRVDVV